MRTVHSKNFDAGALDPTAARLGRARGSQRANAAVDGARATRPGCLDATLVIGRDIVVAHFNGMRPPPQNPALDTPFHWAKTADAPPAGALAPVCLGTGEGGYLHLDLALAPGVITLSGDIHVREELGAEVINRLTSPEYAHERHMVVIAGEPVRSELLAHSPVRVPTLADFDPSRFADAEICFLVCPLTKSGDDAVLIETFTARPAPRVIPIVIDDVAGSDWSILALPRHWRTLGK